MYCFIHGYMYIHLIKHYSAIKEGNHVICHNMNEPKEHCDR